MVGMLNVCVPNRTPTDLDPIIGYRDPPLSLVDCGILARVIPSRPLSGGLAKFFRVAPNPGSAHGGHAPEAARGSNG